jgi:hypothetical protein
MSLPKHDPREQNNYGGLLIGRDLNIETLDAKTKAVLIKISKDAPELGRLLAKALRDGVISPDVAFALGAAARSINEDVAGTLHRASRSINEDVASTLYRASERINEETAQQIANASASLSATVRELSSLAADTQWATTSPNDTKSEIREWERIAETIDAAAQNMAYATQAQYSSSAGWSWKSFGWGVGICLVFVITILAFGTFGLQR